MASEVKMRHGSANHSTTVHMLDLSSGKIELLKERTSARKSLIQNLAKLGYGVDFDLDLNQVIINSDSGLDPKFALQYIDDHIVEIEVPVDEATMMLVDNKHALDDIDGELLVRTDKRRSSVKVIGLMNGTDVMKLSMVKSICNSLFERTEPNDNIHEATSDQNDAISSIPVNVDSVDAAQSELFAPSDEESDKTEHDVHSENDLVVATEIDPAVSTETVTTDTGPTPLADDDSVFSDNTDTQPSDVPNEQTSSPPTSVKTTTKFRCKGWAKWHSLQGEIAAIETKYNCSVIHNRTRSASTIHHHAETKEVVVEVRVVGIQLVEADVIVNSVNRSLNLNVGTGVSHILWLAAGKSIQGELHEQHPKGIQPGEVAKTGPGNIRNCKALYHAFVPMYPQDKSAKEYKNTVAECHKALVSVILNVLHMASSDGWKSVALPAFGTGTLGYPVEETVQIMFLAVSQFFESALSPLEKVFFVIFPKAEPSLKQLFLMEKYSSQLKTVKVSRLNLLHREMDKDSTKTYETQFTVGKTLLQIGNGDIKAALDTSKVILVFWHKDNFDRNRVHSVLSSLDTSVQNHIYTQYVSQFQNHTTKKVTDTSSVKGARLIHLYVRSDEDDVIVRAIQRGLRLIEKEDVTTVGIPVPSDGTRMWQPQIAADLILKAVQGLKHLHHVIRVTLQNGYNLEPFLTEVSKTKHCTLHEGPDVSHIVDTIFPLHSCKVPVGDIVIHIASTSDEENQKAAKELKGVLGIKLMYMIKDK